MVEKRISHKKFAHFVDFFILNRKNIGLYDKSRIFIKGIYIERVHNLPINPQYVHR
jgi:hypothetical protein